MRTPSLVVLILLAAGGTADAATALLMGSASSATLTVTIPVTFTSGTSASSDLGVNRTSAATPLNLGKAKVDFPSLLIASGSASAGRAVTLRFNSATGLSNVTAATLKVGNVTQIVIASGLVTQTSGTAVALSAGGNVTFVGNQMSTKGGSDTATLVIDAITTSASGAGGTLTERWTIDIT